MSHDARLVAQNAAALHTASDGGHGGIVSTLLDHGASVDALDKVSLLVCVHGEVALTTRGAGTNPERFHELALCG